MKISVFILFLFSFNSSIYGQSIKGEELLEKTIKFHDPNTNWQTFNGNLEVILKTPNSEERKSKIHINLPEEFFEIEEVNDSNIIQYTIDKGKCQITFNGEENFTETQKERYNLNCDRATLWKNYYTYLYGLPMKLKDPDTQISETVIRKVFKGKEYLVLNVKYNTLKSDIWNFYFDPETYAMEIYQFFKTDDQGDFIKDSGEYILLSQIETINNIKIPKVRAWYYNKDDKYLRTDILKQ